MHIKRSTFMMLLFTCIVGMNGTPLGAAGPKEISVDFEYGSLKEVIVGVPFTIYPDLEVAKWAQEAIKILPETEAKKMREVSGKDSITIGKFDQMEKENKELIAILEKHGVKVWRPEVLTRESGHKLRPRICSLCWRFAAVHPRSDSRDREQRDREYNGLALSP